MLKTDVLFYVEDPGAANYVAQLPAALARRGIGSRLFACGVAREYLRQFGLAFEEGPLAEDAGRLLASVGPRLLVVGTSENVDTAGLTLVEQARAAGVRSVGVVDARANAARRFRGRGAHPLTYAPDWLLVPDEWTREAYARLGYHAARAVVCGHPHYDHVRDTAARLGALDRKALRDRIMPGAGGRRVLVFAAEVSTGLGPRQYRRSAGYTLRGGGKSTGRTEIVIEEILNALRLLGRRPYLVLRLHPKNSPVDFAPYLGEFDRVSKDEPPLELIYAADLVVGMSSMILLEAALMGRLTLSVVPRPSEAEWLPSDCMGILCATTRDELKGALEQLLSGDTPGRAAPLEGVAVGSLKHTTDAIERLLRA